MKIGKLLRTLILFVLCVIVLWLVIAAFVYSPEYVYRTIVWQGSDSFDWQKFPSHPLIASATPYQFADSPDPRVEETFGEIAGVMETGVNARAIDFAKFGELFLNGGNWQGKQVISKAWVDESTQPLFPPDYTDYYSDWYDLLPGKGYYKYMWYSLARDENAYDFAAEGDKGQFIYVSPMKNMVIVRNGIDYGIASEEWFNLFYEFANRY